MHSTPLGELAKLMIKSLAYEPATLEDLIKREFIQKSHNAMDERFAWSLLQSLSDYWYEDKNGLFHVYASKKNKVLSDSFA